MCNDGVRCGRPVCFFAHEPSQLRVPPSKPAVPPAALAIHLCIGMALAKQELRIMAEELLPNIESIELTGPAKVVQTTFVGGLKNLPVKITFAE